MVVVQGYFVRWNILLMLTVLVLAGTPLVSAHAPLGTGSNEDIANATFFGNPEKSFALYTELHESGEAQYYHFPMRSGDILYGSLQVPGPGSMIPDLVITGPGIRMEGDIPSFIEIPSGSGAMLVPGEPPGNPSYEPFTPQPIYEVARFNVTIPVDGDYYIAVFGSGGGKYSLAPGFREEFTAAEWLSVPVSVLSIYLWEGQPIAEVLAPFFIVLTGGLILVFFHRKKGFPDDPVGWLAIISGLLYLGGAAITATQTVRTLLQTGYSPEVVLTIVFIAAAIIPGIAAIRTGTRVKDHGYPLSGGIGMVLIGLLGLVVWAGLIAGPVIAVISGTLVIAKHPAKPGSE